MKIRTKINLTFFISFVVVILVIGAIIGYESNQALKKQAYEQIQNINNARAEHVRTFLKSETEVINILAASTVFRDFLKLDETAKNYLTEKERTEKRLLRSMGSVAQIYELFLLDRRGRIVASTDETKIGQDKSQDFYFLEGQKNVYIKDFYFSEEIKKDTYTVSAPLNDDTTGDLLGVVVARMDPENLYSIVESEVALGETGESFLINTDKYLLTPTRFLDKEAVLKQKIETQNTIDCFAPEEIKETTIFPTDTHSVHIGHEVMKNYIDYRGMDIIGTHSYIPEADWYLITEIDKAEVLAPSYRMLSIFIGVSIISLFIFLFIGWLVSRRLTKPIYDLQTGVLIVEKGNLDYEVPTKANDEIGELAHSFNGMTSAIKKSRAEIDLKVKEQTEEIQARAEDMADQQKAVLNILEDVEEEKSKAETLAAIVDDAEEPIVGKTLEGIVTSWNHGAEKLYGYLEEEMLGKSINIIVPDDKKDELDKILKEISLGKNLEHFPTVRQKKDGSLVDVSLSVSPIKDVNGKIIGASAITLDITKEKQIDKAKTEFVSLASHQLRTPLSSINWYAEMLLNGDAGKLKTEQKTYLEQIYQSNQRMVELVNALLNVSRLELGTFVVEPVEIDLIEIIKSLLQELDGQIKEKKLKLKQNFDKNIKNYLGDPKLLRIVFQNLLSNAVKYTLEEGSVTIELKKQKNEILFKVSDTGLGIPKNQQDKIFNKLFRADNVRETDTEGTGLGLYIVKSIVNYAGGKVWFESQENRGTDFYVALPVKGMQKKEGTKQLD